MSLDVTTITTYINYFFVVLAVVFFVGFIVGLLKGFYRSLSSLIASFVVVILIIFLNKTISNYIYNYNIEGFTNLIQFELPEGVSTFGQYVEVFVKEQLKEMGSSLEYSKISDSIVTISKSLVNVITLITLSIIGLIDMLILDLLLYNTLFRFAISPEKRKKNKRRIMSSFIAALNASVIFALIMSPFTALLNTITTKLRNEDGEIIRVESSNDYYNAIMNVVEGYNNSGLAKLFFSFTNNEGKTIDVSLLDKLTYQTTSKGENINTYTELGNLSYLLVNALSTGAIKATGEIDYALLLGSSFVVDMLDMVKDSVLMQTLLSLGATIAINNDEFKNNIDLSSVDFYDVDWTNNATALRDIYQELQNVGLINNVLSSPNEFFTSFRLDDTRYSNSIKASLRKLDESSLINKVVPHVITSYMNKLQIGEIKLNKQRKSKVNNELIVPSNMLETSTYENIRWGEELASIYEVGENLSKQYFGYYEKGITLGELSSINTSNLLDILFGQGINFALTNDSNYADRFNNNPFVNGGYYKGFDIPGTLEILGTSGNEGILNLQLMDVMFENGFINNLVSSYNFDSLLNSNSSYSISKNISSLTKDYNKNDWKSEINSLVKVASPIVNIISNFKINDTSLNMHKKMLNNEEETLTISINDILSDDTLDSMKYLTDVIDSSSIFNNVLPNFLDDYFTNNDQELIGFNLSDLNFTSFTNSDQSMSTELRKLVDVLSDNNDEIIDFISSITLDGNDVLDVIINDCNKNENSILSLLLNTFNESQILNDQTKVGTKTFTKLMINVLGKTDDESLIYNIYNLTNHLIGLDIETILNIDNDPSLSWNKEILGITKFISSLKVEDGDSGILMNYILGKLPKDYPIEKEIFKCGDEVEKLLSNIDESSLLSNTIIDLIENVLGEQIENYLGVKPNFNNVKSWKDEGVYLNSLLTKVNEIVKDNDISTFDFTSLSEEDAEELFSIIYDTQCVGGSYNESSRENGVFSELIENLTLDIIYEKLDIDLYSKIEKSIIDEDFNIENNKIKYDENTYVSWKNDNSSYKGEIKNITSLIFKLKNINENTTILDLKDILSDLNNSYVLRTITSIIIKEKTSSYNDELRNNFIDKSNFDVFNSPSYSLTPYHIEDNQIILDKSNLTYRIEEINVRQNELDNIINIISKLDKVNEALESENLYRSVQEILLNKSNSLDVNNEMSLLEETLILMSNSSVFNNKVNNQERDLTAFEYVFSYINNDSSLNTLLTPISEEKIIEFSSSSSWEDQIKLFNDQLYLLVTNELSKSSR